MVKKGDKLDNLLVETMASEGKTIAKTNGMVIFLQGGAPGDTVEAEVTKIKTSYMEGRVTSILNYSPHRAEPFCIHFGMCGGCSWQHIDYETQLFYKQKQVVDNLERIGGLILPEIRPIIPSTKTRHYRNRLDFTFSANRWLSKEELQAQHSSSNRNSSPLRVGDGRALPTEAPIAIGAKVGGEVALGFHIPRMYDKVFDVKECHLQPDPSNAIRLAVKQIAVKEGIDFFDLRKQIGFLRSLTIRTANTGDVMTILQVAYEKAAWTDLILNSLSEKFPQITSLLYVINGKRNDTFSDLEVLCWKGKTYITETMPKPDSDETLQFRVGPKSFYQTNSYQAHALYDVAWAMADLKGDEHIYDLYTGTGTIANFFAGRAKKVIGLENVAAAVEDARINSQINKIDNTEFYAGDIKELLNNSFLTQHGHPDLILTDPPRVGMHEDVNRMLLEASPKRIIYISCNPATQARDLKILCEKYSITAVQPVDMFPQTMHVENVVRLDKR